MIIGDGCRELFCRDLRIAISAPSSCFRMSAASSDAPSKLIATSREAFAR
jgi:hypothetical protein